MESPLLLRNKTGRGQECENNPRVNCYFFVVWWGRKTKKNKNKNKIANKVSLIN